MQVILAKLVNSKNDYFTIEARQMNTQSETTEYGLFSAAYCTSLANGQDPSTIILLLSNENEGSLLNK